MLRQAYSPTTCEPSYSAIPTCAVEVSTASSISRLHRQHDGLPQAGHRSVCPLPEISSRVLLHPYARAGSTVVLPVQVHPCARAIRSAGLPASAWSRDPVLPLPRWSRDGTHPYEINELRPRVDTCLQ